MSFLTASSALVPMEMDSHASFKSTAKPEEVSNGNCRPLEIILREAVRGAGQIRSSD
jgi:hypothetical protein